jgi:hypothetical protein
MMPRRELDEKTRWGLFTRALATLLELSPDEAEMFVIASRPPELCNAMFSMILDDVFPRLSRPKREVFARIVHVLEQRPLEDA